MVAALRRDASTSRSRSWPSDQRLPEPARLRRQIALEFLFGKWAAVAEDASAGTFDDEGAPARRVAGRACQRLRNGIADDGIAAKFLRGCEAGQGEERAGKDRTRHAMRASSQRLPP